MFWAIWWAAKCRRRNDGSPNLPCSLALSLSHFGIFVPHLLPANTSTPNSVRTSHQEISKGLKARQRLLPIPHRALRSLCLDVHCSDVKVQHLTSSERLRGFVESKWPWSMHMDVFIISRCTQQQETTCCCLLLTTFWLYEVPTGVIHNNVQMNTGCGTSTLPTSSSVIHLHYL